MKQKDCNAFLSIKGKPKNKIDCIAWLLLNVFGCKFCETCREKPCKIKDGECCTDNIADYIREAVKEENATKPKTNFDRITESAEAFADWIFKSYTNVPENVPCTVENCETTDRMDCKKCFIEWLQKEAK